MSAEAVPALRPPASLHVVALALALVYVVWGSTYLAIRWALDGGWPPLLMAGTRFLIAGGLMYAVLRARGVAAPTRRQWRNILFVSVLLLGLGNGMVCIAEQTVSSGLAAVAVASAPLWMGLFAAIRGEQPHALEWVGLGIGFIGVLWLNAGSSLTATPVSLVALLIAPLAWAFGSIWSRGRDLPSPFMNAAAQMLCAGVVLPVAGFAFGERMDAMPSLAGMLSFGYLVSFGSIIGFTAYVWLLHNVRPALASSYAYVNPVIAVALGVGLASERFSAQDYGAMAVVLVGVVAITLARTRKVKTA